METDQLWKRAQRKVALSRSHSVRVAKMGPFLQTPCSGFLPLPHCLLDLSYRHWELSSNPSAAHWVA